MRELFLALTFLAALLLSAPGVLASRLRDGGAAGPPPAPRQNGAFTQDVPKAARTALERAMKLSAAGKPQLAVALMQEAVKIFPAYFDAHFALGNELTKLGRLDEAIAALEEARKVNPKDERLYELFGLILLRQRKYPMAAAVFAEASRLNPADPQPHLMRAFALVHHAHSIKPSASERAAADRKYFLKLAGESLARASEVSGGQQTADHFTMALFYEMRGERGRAAGELEQYLQKNPDAPNAQALRDAIKKLREPPGTRAEPPPRRE